MLPDSANFEDKINETQDHLKDACGTDNFMTGVYGNIFLLLVLHIEIDAGLMAKSKAQMMRVAAVLHAV